MKECTDKHLGVKLYAYETGMMNDTEREKFEIHLLECKYCNERARRFSQEADLIRHDRVVRDSVARMDERDRASTNRRSKLTGTIVAVAAVLILLIFKPWQLEFHSTEEAFAESNRLAVMYFENLTDQDDPERLGEIIANLLITDLSQSRYIGVVSGQRLHDILILMGQGDTRIISKDIATAAAREARARWMLTGGIVQVEPALILTAQLVEISSGDVVASRRIETQADESLFSLVDRLTVEIKNVLSLPAEADQEFDAPVAEVTTHSAEAYQHYLAGVDFYHKLYRDEAAQSFRRALEYDSTFAMVYYYLSDLEDVNLITEAVAYSDGASEKERLYIESRHALILDDTDRAIACLKEILANYPDEKAAMMILAAIAETEHRYNEAIKLLRDAIEIDPLNKRAFNRLAYVYDRQGELDEAVSAVDRYIDLAPDEANPYDSKGEILARNGRLEEAIQLYGKVAALKPDFYNYGSMATLGRLHVFAGNYDSATSYFQYIAANGPRAARSAARTDMAMIPLYQGRLDEALDILRDGIAADRMEQATTGQYGDRALKHFIRGRIHVEKRDFDSACLELEEAINVHYSVFSGDRPAFRCSYAQVLAESGDFAAAQKIIDVLRDEYQADFKPAKFAYWYALGSVHLARGDTVQAAASFDKMVEDHSYYDGDVLRAITLQQAGRLSEAITELERQLADYTPRWRLVLGLYAVKSYYHLALAYEQTNQFDEAIVRYEQFLSIWKDADPVIAEIEDARTRLAVLKSKL